MISDWVIAVISNTIGVIVGSILTHVLQHAQKPLIWIDNLTQKYNGVFEPIKGLEQKPNSIESIESIDVDFVVNVINKTSDQIAIINPRTYIKIGGKSVCIRCLDLENIGRVRTIGIISDFKGMEIPAHEFKKIRLRASINKEYVEEVFEKTVRLSLEWKNEKRRKRNIAVSLPIMLLTK